jgi:hypothetical protein
MSSCSRRQLARRRPGRSSFRVQLLLVALVVVVGLVAFVAGHGGI